MLEVLKGIFTLLGTASFIIVVGLICVRLNVFKSSTQKTVIAKVAVALVFGVLAVYGTLMGTETSGAIVNVRELAAMIAGVTGGPVSGLIAGLIGGVHRYSVGGFTALACSLSTVISGVVAGFAAKWINRKLFLLKGAAVGLVLESFAMALILLLSQPSAQAVATVEQIAIPMITADTTGLVLWLYVSSHKKPE